MRVSRSSPVSRQLNFWFPNRLY